MDAFAARDEANGPPSDGIVFVGSSSIRMWDLSDWFPTLPVTNRGFGGSHIADSTHYFELLIARHRPRTVVLYAGDNDIAHGLTPEEVVADYRAFVGKLQATFPETKLVFVAIKPSIARWNLYPKMREANARIAEIAANDDRQTFLDIATPMLAKEDGRPDPRLFLDDGLHLNEAGYELWSKLLRPYLE